MSRRYVRGYDYLEPRWLSPAAEAELERLHETHPLACVVGGVWGGAVIVARNRDAGIYGTPLYGRHPILELDPAEWPELTEACEVRVEEEKEEAADAITIHGESLYELPLTWESDPVSFASAAQIWGSAAGVAGAYAPTHLARIGEEWAWARGNRSPSPNEIEEVVAEAVRRADREHSISGRSGPNPLRPESFAGMVVWQTSVAVVLRRSDPGQHQDSQWVQWVVSIFGEHAQRQGAAEQRAVSLEARDQVGHHPLPPW